jgi:O-succinylbenzoic acid--CoA ligase
MEISLNEHFFALKEGVSSELLKKVKNELSQINHHQKYLIMNSSGSSGVGLKFYFIPHSHMLGHAEQINYHFGINNQHKWLLCLPSFYMGGLSILYRNQLSKGQVYHLGLWSAQDWFKLMESSQSTHCSMVPRQLYDVVYLGKAAPKSLEMLFIGGDRLDRDLRYKALALGYPLYETYGMTEFCSQLATKAQRMGDSSRQLDLLPFVQARQNPEGILTFKSEYHYDFLLELCADGQLKKSYYHEQLDPEGFFPSQDIGLVDRTGLLVQGRRDENIKINGKFVNIKQLEEKLIANCAELHYQDFVLAYQDDLKFGKKVLFFSIHAALSAPLKKLLSREYIEYGGQVEQILWTHSMKKRRQAQLYLAK